MISTVDRVVFLIIPTVCRKCATACKAAVIADGRLCDRPVWHGLPSDWSSNWSAIPGQIPGQGRGHGRGHGAGQRHEAGALGGIDPLVRAGADVAGPGLLASCVRPLLISQLPNVEPELALPGHPLRHRQRPPRRTPRLAHGRRFALTHRTPSSSPGRSRNTSAQDH